MSAIPVREFYQKYRGQTAHILGAAPCLLNELKRFPPRDGFVIALNSAFLACPEYDIHLLANHEFVELYQKEFTFRGIALKPNSFAPMGYEQEFYYFPSRAVEQDHNLVIECNNSLIASLSVLIPALHFVLRCDPRIVYLYGIDMAGAARHWDDGETGRRSLPRFPGRGKICRHLNLLRQLFVTIEVICLNRDSLLVRKGIVEAMTKKSGKYVANHRRGAEKI